MHRGEDMEYTIEDFEQSMTVFYFKRTGEIKNISYGISDMSFYGTNEQDYSLIVDFIVVNRDAFVFERVADFIVDLETKNLVYRYSNNYKKYLK